MSTEPFSEIIIDAEIDQFTGNLIITLPNSNLIDAGRARGQDGLDGADGVNGIDGKDGADGVSVTDFDIDNNGDLIATLSNNQTINSGHVVGPQGLRGEPGERGPIGQTGEKGEKGDTGAPLLPKGTLTTSDSLPPTGVEGDAYMIDGDLWVWLGTAWQNVGKIQGPAGTPGSDGKDGVDGTNGLSAYEIAINEGFSGTVDQWLASLKGPKGDQGEKGATGDDGPIGPVGADGRSAYQVALDNGYVGTEAEWVASLAGTDGADGASAYEVAVLAGYTGTEADWLNDLQGADGATGDSAYQVWLNTGNTGTETDFLASLVGQQGEPGLQGEPGENGADGVGIPAGGTAGQILSKSTATDFDTAWIDAPSGSGFSGDYNDLTNKPTIPDATSDLANDSGFITAADVPADTVQSVAGRTGDITLTATDVGGLATVATSGEYDDLTGTPTIPTKTSELTNDSSYITLAQVPKELPTGGTDGQVLTSDGAGAVAWETPSGSSLPTGGIDGQVLTSDGAGNAAWENISAPDVSIYEIWNEAAPTETIFDFSHINYRLNSDAACIIGTPTNLKIGQSGVIGIRRYSGSDISFGNIWKFPGGVVPDLYNDQTTMEFDMLYYVVMTEDWISCRYEKRVDAISVGGSNLTVGSTAPINPALNDLWVDIS